MQMPINFMAKTRKGFISGLCVALMLYSWNIAHNKELEARASQGYYDYKELPEKINLMKKGYEKSDADGVYFRSDNLEKTRNKITQLELRASEVANNLDVTRKRGEVLMYSFVSAFSYMGIFLSLISRKRQA